MCSPTAALAAGMGMKAYGVYSGWKAQDAYAAQQRRDVIAQMNQQVQNYNAERQDAYDYAVTEMMKANQNALQLNSQTEAAVDEDYAGGGRTADALMRHSLADNARYLASVKDNYRRKFNEIMLNREAAIKSGYNTVKGIKGTTRKGRFADILGLAADGFMAYNTYQGIKDNKKTGGKSGV
ncbi:hypothetical protein [Allisonella histaminiformans]|uniref:virion core protein, T7 gp14 family n=1 Tax=Allisonella histaminiformans TaxID=209880 RepID=UPI0029436A5F|nr:hypothetical protein [Allisonella histaminiformans]